MPGSDELLGQGAHPDPLDPAYQPPDPSTLPDQWRDALASPEMEVYRASLMLPGQPSVRASILDDLSTYYHLDPDECVRRCVHWEEWSVQEWQERPRDSAAGLSDFYNTTESWSFDHIWAAYLQAEGAVYPAAVVAARTIPRVARTLRCLDFGSGVGDMGHLLGALGHEVDLADVSKTLLAFARYRLERRGQQAGYVDLNDAEPEPGRYDVAIAKDVLAHVPDFRATVVMLHRSLRPGGLLLTNFDTRPASPENAWHLYSDDLPLRRVLQDIGFEQLENLSSRLFVFRRVQPTGLPHLVRRARNAILLGPLRRTYRDGRWALRRLLAGARTG
jgi:2-polyprenyl-3-methyl-5-hydroxy-6-metoxy-1,4-benzoquinol methylase